MLKKNQSVTALLERWRNDLRELFAGVANDPFAEGRGRHWDRDFPGDINNADIFYSIFIGVMSLLPAAIVAYVSSEPQWKMLGQFFRAPIQVVISGFLTAALIFIGTHINRSPRPFPVAFKLMLRIMAIHPILGFLQLFPYGEVVGLVIYGLFVVRGVRKTYTIPVRNALLFFGVIYVVFALLQLQAMLRPVSAKSHFSFFPPSNATICTSSSSSTPKVS